ncbi:MAG: HDOD domain-containing protein [Thermodesulfobacteriota bacterium]|nr:HDOD domain-containing protein [Thermodesulfobacteriota bacterium]
MTAHKGIELDLIDIPFNENLEKPKPVKRPYLELILKQIEKQEALLSFSGQIEQMNKILEMRYASTDQIASVLLKDFALTSKLLNLANSSFYGQFNTGYSFWEKKGISTVSEALIILGTDLIQQTAASLKIFEFMQKMSNNEKLKQKAVFCFMRSIIARNLAYHQRLENFEEYQVSAMLLDLGEYVTLFFFPEIQKEVDLVIKNKRIVKEAASRKILGTSYSKIGRTVAEKWRIPEKIISTIKPVYLFSAPVKHLTESLYKRYASSFAGEITDLNWEMSKEDLIYRLTEIVERYSFVFDLDLAYVRELFSSSRKEITKHAKLLNIDLKTMYHMFSK